MGSRRYIRQAIEGSLRRLRTDYIDLYQMHWADPRTPWQETLSALDELVKEGKVLYIGSSHLTGWEVIDTDWIARSQGFERMISAQNHYNLLERSAERELVPACLHAGVGLLPYFPLASGLLTGKYRRGSAAPSGTRLAGTEISDDNFDRIEALDRLAVDAGHTLLELAIAGLAARPGVASVITGATTADQIRNNAAALDWEMGADEVSALDGVLR